MTKFYPKPANFESKSQVAPNSLISNPNISDRAVRLLLILNAIATSGGNWVPMQADLQNRLGWGEEKMRSAIKECCEKGYMIVKQNRSEKSGQKGQYSHHEFEFCLDGSYKKNNSSFTQNKPSHNECEPAGYFPDPGTPGPGNRALVVTYEEVVPVEEIVCVPPPPVGEGSPEKIVKKKFDNSFLEISKSELYTACVQKRLDWTSSEIDAAWDILVKYESPLRDWFSFCEGTVKNLRKIEGLKQLKIRNKQKCPTMNLTKLSSSEPKSSNPETSTDGTRVRPLADWKSLVGLK